MKPIAVIVAFLMLLTALPALAHDGVKDKKQEEGKRRGYVLQPGEGEKLGPVRIIKASPKSGTQGGVMVLDELPPGLTTGIHVHTVADEFFISSPVVARRHSARTMKPLVPAMSSSSRLAVTTPYRSMLIIL